MSRESDSIMGAATLVRVEVWVEVEVEVARGAAVASGARPGH